MLKTATEVHNIAQNKRNSGEEEVFFQKIMEVISKGIEEAASLGKFRKEFFFNELQEAKMVDADRVKSTLRKNGYIVRDLPGGSDIYPKFLVEW